MSRECFSTPVYILTENNIICHAFIRTLSKKTTQERQATAKKYLGLPEKVKSL